MEYIRTGLFRRSFKKLDASQKELIRGALRELAKNPHHPYPPQLNVHKLSGRTGKARDGKKVPIWEFHATGYLIITFHTEGDDIMLRNCGPHDDVLRNP